MLYSAGTGNPTAGSQVEEFLFLPVRNIFCSEIQVDTNCEFQAIELLSSLNPNKAAGPDCISSRILKALADELYRPLAALYQNSLNSGLVPNQWKSALVTPIFKKGDKHNPANYRPVSLTSICCKVLEHIVAKALLCHLESNKILIENQHGFRHSRSCETQLLMFVDELLRSMSKGMQINVVIMDFSKAFDMVPHNSLLVKLSGYGIQDKMLDWIGSFLSDRSQRVVVEGEQSDPAPVTLGCLRGLFLAQFFSSSSQMTCQNP